MMMIAHLVATMEIALGVFNELLMKSGAGVPLVELEDDYYSKRGVFLQKCEREIREIDKKSNGLLVLDEFEDIHKNEMFASLWMSLLIDKNLDVSR